MADIIQADYDRLEQIAQRFTAQSDNIAAMKGQLEQTMSPLVYEGGWIGEGADAFRDEMESLALPGVERLQEALAEASRVTLEINRLVREAEEEASAPFKGGEFVGQPVGGSGGTVGGDQGVSIGQPVGGSGGSLGGDQGVSIGQPVGGSGGSLPNERDSYLFGTIQLEDEPMVRAPLSTTQQVVVTGLGVVAVGADLVSTFISGAGTLIEGGAAAVDGPAPVGEAVGLAAYYFAVKPWETGVGLVGLGATGISDIVQGNTYVSGTELVIGQDSLVAGGAFVGSLPLEGASSTVVNVGMLGYDAASLAGYSPTIAGHRWEMRTDFSRIPPSTYFVGYPPSE